MTRFLRLFAAAVLLLVLALPGSTGQTRTALYTLPGDAPMDGLGWCVAAAGDVDGDGVPDFLATSAYAGYVRVFSGKDGSTLHTFTGQASDGFGQCAAAAGDVDGDGCGDIIVGSPFEFVGKIDTGTASVYSGKDGSRLHHLSIQKNPNSQDYFGWSVGTVGDVDGDKLDDVIAGGIFAQDPSGNSTGIAIVFSGKDGSVIHTLYGDNGGDEFGSAVASIGDLDGDGAAEFAVGGELGFDPNNKTRPGLVRVCGGKDGGTIQTLYGDYDFDYFGFSVSGIGDLDGDGLPDLAVGASMADDGSGIYPGMARVCSTGSWSSLFDFYGQADGDTFGQSVSGAADVDGDGVADLIVGAPYALDSGGTYVGTATVYSGKDGSEILTLYGAADRVEFGGSVAGLPDLDGDKKDDFLVGSPTDDGAGDDAGAAFLYTIPAPAGTVLIDGDAVATASADVTLDLAWTPGGSDVSDMRFRDAGGEWGAWEPVASTYPWTLPGGDGEKTVEAQFRDVEGLVSGEVGDSILLDTTPPGGTVSIMDGAAWWNSADVTLGLVPTDATSGVSHYRVRNGGEIAFGPWTAIATSVPFTLTAGAGAKTVDVEFRDRAGNVSPVASDSISIDLTAPTGSIVIAGGAAQTKERTVTLSLVALDSGGSGLALMRIRRGDSPTWGAWVAHAASLPWTLASGDGAKEVQAQFRDGAGNDSPVYSDSIVLDQTVPEVTLFAVHGARPYFLPEEDVGFDIAASDPNSGTGVTEARVSFDAGATWTGWGTLPSGSAFVPVRPALEGDVSAVAMVRDAAGNESAPSAAVALYLVEAAPPFLGTGGAATGAMSGPLDVDALALDLVKDDVLSIKVKAAAAVKGQPFPLMLDLARPDGTRLFLGRYPAGAKAVGVAGYVVPETGRYFIVLRQEGAGAGTGTYSLAAGVKQAKTNSSLKGSTGSGEVVFEAAEGAVLKGSLKGAGLDPASVTITGPDGSVAVAAIGKPGSAKFGPVTLGAGTGTYRISFTATGPVAFSAGVKLPKGGVPVTE